MTTPNEELIARLRLHDDARLYREADELMSEAADLLQSQAERIKEFEGACVPLSEYADLALKNDTLRAQLAEQTKAADHWMGEACESHNAAVRCAERLAEIGKAEPVAHQFQTVDGGWHPLLTDKHYQDTKADGRWPIRELFTRPMPAQDVTELVELLEFMWRDVPMNGYAFEKLEAALSKYKGAK